MILVRLPDLTASESATLILEIEKAVDAFQD